MEEESKQRLAKVLAARGVASRREAEKLIERGLVEVEGEVVRHPGHPVDPECSRIFVDGKQVAAAPRKVYYLLNKPTGYIVSRSDPDGRRSVLELFPELPERVEPVGRLDINTEGALLLTNDGSLAHALTHPSREIPKRYLVKVWKEPSAHKLEQLEGGVHLEDGKTAPAKVRIVESTENGNTWLELTVTEGRNRLVRRMFAAIGHPVSKLKRISFATISTRELPVGSFRLLTADEVARLRELARGVNPQRAGQKKRSRKAGFAAPGEAWMKKRVHRKAR